MRVIMTQVYIYLKRENELRDMHRHVPPPHHQMNWHEVSVITNNSSTNDLFFVLSITSNAVTDILIVTRSLQ